MAILSLRDVSLVKGGKQILKDITLDVWEGYVHALVGPNGAGKSTLAASIMGIPGYREISGDILFEGTSIKTLRIDERARLGITLAWQEPARFEGIPVFEYIRFSAKRKTAEEVRRALELLGLDPDRCARRKVDTTLSGGERKRIELAAIVAMEPKLVLLDEPDSGVDIEAVDRIFTMIRLLKEKGTTVMLITHSAEVLKQADHAFLLCNGSLVKKGETAKILPYFSGQCYPCVHPNEPVLKEVEVV